MNDIETAFIKGMEAIEPYLDKLVIAGGWAPYLYAQIYKSGIRRNPLITKDIDLVVAERGFVEDVPTLDETIIAAGFRHDFASLDDPPVVRYINDSSEKSIIEIEFITNASGQREGVVKIGSINAQSLRYVRPLLENPWSFDLADAGHHRNLIVRLPRPSAYLFHKALTSGRRNHEDKTAKDLYYIFYVLESFPEWRAQTLLEISKYSTTRKPWVDKALAYLQPRFADMDSPGIDYLVSQRPRNEFMEMSEDQFRHYSLHVMSELIESMM